MHNDRYGRPTYPNYQTASQPAFEAVPMFDERPHGASSEVVISIGAVICLATLIPIWNGFTLLHDETYIFFAGTTMPIMIISLCLFCIVLYTCGVNAISRKLDYDAHSKSTALMIASVFTSVLGGMLMVTSLPISTQAIDAYTNLVYHCHTSELTRNLYEHFQVLQSIRTSAACSTLYSVEECSGYLEVQRPYTELLKAMEADFQCAGFCYTSTQTQLTTVASSRSVPLPSANAHTPRVANTSTHPLTLFSNSNFTASCESMMARGMKDTVGDIGHQTFYHGIVLILVSVTGGFLNLFSLCSRTSGHVTDFDEKTGIWH